MANAYMPTIKVRAAIDESKATSFLLSYGALGLEFFHQFNTTQIHD